MDQGTHFVTLSPSAFYVRVILSILDFCVHLSWYSFIKVVFAPRVSRYTSHRMVVLRALKGGCDLWFLQNVFLKSCTERLPVSGEKHTKYFLWLYSLTLIAYSQWGKDLAHFWKKKKKKIADPFLIRFKWKCVAMGYKDESH